jgi:hypothetical protein
VFLSLTAAGCTGNVGYSTTPELPNEPFHYVIVEVSKAPEPDAVSAHEWARSRYQRFALWSVASTQPDVPWIVADLGVAVIAEKLEVGQMLNAVEGYRAPLHVVVDGSPPPMLRAGSEAPAHCSVRGLIGRTYDLDCELAALGPLIAADWVSRLQFYKPGRVRWK